MNLSRFDDKYDWSRLEFPVGFNKTGVFEKKNNISVNVLGVKGLKPYQLRKSKYSDQKTVNLLLITNGEKRQYTAIKNMSSLTGTSNSKHVHKQHICLNCLQGFHSKKSRDNHLEYCKNNEAVRIEMHEKGSFVEFHDGQDQFKVPFVMYADLESLLMPTKESDFYPGKSYTKEINQHIPSGFGVERRFAYGSDDNSYKSYKGKDCVKVLCNHLKNEAKRFSHMSSDKPMKPLTNEQRKEYNKVKKCHICSKSFKEDDIKVRDN